MGTVKNNFTQNNSPVWPIIHTLQSGEISLVGRVLMGSNATLLVDVKSETRQFQAIYKPNQGERPLWDFPEKTLAQREVAAFIVSRLLAWNYIPPTTYRSKNLSYGPGSLQLFIPHDPNKHYFNISDFPRNLRQNIVLFDYIINNADRKGGHIIQDHTNHFWLIDHGVSFNQELKLRTVLWEHAGESIPDNLLLIVSEFLVKMQSNNIQLVKRLKQLLAKTEFDAIINRADTLLSTKIFPLPNENTRPYPWPLI